jgi:hypothetical protein
MEDVMGGGINVQANRIFRDFLAPQAEQWVCVDQMESDEIRRKLDAELIDNKMYDIVQRQVYVNMEKDLVPRFARSFDVDDTPAVSSPSSRGSVRFIPDSKLRATVKLSVTE